MKATETPDGVVVESDRVAFFVPPEPTVALERLETRGAGRRRAVERVAVDGVGRDGRVVVEEVGRWKTVIRQTGTIESPSGRIFRSDRRITTWTGAAEVVIETWLRADVGRGRAGCDVAIELARGSHRAIGPDGSRRRGEAVEIVADVDGTVTTSNPSASDSKSRRRRRRPAKSKSASKAKSSSALAVVARAGGIAVAVRDFEHLTPGTLSFDGANRVTMTLVSGDYNWWPGTRAGRAIRLRLRGRERRTRTPVAFRDPLVIYDDDAMDDGVGASAAAGRRLLDLATATFDASVARRNGMDWRGEENAGDWRWSRDDAGNLEYDTTFGLEAAGRASKRPDLLERAERAARHLVRRDLDLGRSGLPLRHGRFHRLGGVEAGHVWLEGLLAVARRTADPFLLDAAGDLGRAWSNHVRGAALRRWNMRSLAWGVLTSQVVHRHFGDAASAEARDTLVAMLDEVFAPGLPSGRLGAEVETFFIHPWVDLGLTSQVVARLDPSPSRERLRQRLRVAYGRVTSWAWRSGTLASSLEIDRGGERLIHAKGSCTGEELLFYALGAARLGLETDVGTMVTRGLATLRLRDKTLVGKEVSQILWLWPRLFGK